MGFSDVGGQFKLDSQGFTLTEMLVTVGVVGLLAAVSIPSYQKFTARSHQAEAKTLLSAVYTAERNFSVDARTYTFCLKQLGLTNLATGNHYYAVGMDPANFASPTGCGGAGLNPCSTYVYDSGNPVSQCVLTDSLPIAQNVAANNSTPLITTAVPQWGALNYGLVAPGTMASSTAFIAAAAGNISTSGYDNWSIDNNQVLGNIRSGL